MSEEEPRCLFPELACADCIAGMGKNPPCYIWREIRDPKELDRRGYVDVDVVTEILVPKKLSKALIKAWGNGIPTLAGARMKAMLIEAIVKNEELRKAIEQGCLFIW